MAQTFPERPVGSVSPEVARAFRGLKRLPAAWKVWQHLAPWDCDAPDFCLLDGRGRVLLLQVSRATPRQAQQSPQMELLGLEGEKVCPGRAEETRLADFLERLCREGVPAGGVAAAVLFPNLAPEDLRVARRFAVEPRHRWLDKGWLSDPPPGTWAGLFAREPLDDRALHALRAEFTPEAIVPASFVPRIRRRSVEAEMGDYLLDYDQEHVLKTDLDLDAGSEQLSRDLRIQVVNGVTGSGKTLILLYRLRLLHEMFPRKRFLVLTHNRPLIREMQARFQRLAPGRSSRIDWHTFQGWCRKNWPEHHPFYPPISAARRRSLIREVRAGYLAGSSVSEKMLESELGWVKDSGIVTREEYLLADRRGRGFRLTQDQREQMFAAIHAYQSRLIDGERMDWWDVPRRMWHWIESGEVALPSYDVVLVDEAQFFAPVWFDVVRRLVRPELGYLFVAADPTQGFLHRGESWRAIAGLEVRGRSHQLRRSYRTTRAILDCATVFYRHRLPGDGEAIPAPDAAGAEQGKRPRLLRFDSPQDERTRIVNEIAQAVERGLSPRHVLVLLASWRGAAALRNGLNRRLGRVAVDPKDVPPGDTIRVTTINAGTGLESPAVFVAGVQHLFEAEGSLRLGEEEKAELVRENTRKLYVAFTRAGHRLVVTCVGDVPPPLQELAREGLLTVE
jgi:hypothetical protein